MAPTAGAPNNSTAANPSDTLAANTGASGVVYTWQVVACSAPGVCDTKTVTVTVPAPGGGGCGGGAACSSLGFVHTRVLNRGWPACGLSWNTQALGGLGVNDALVIKFTPPAGSASSLNNAGSISLAEYGDPQTGRYAVLSTSPCDFSGTGGSFSIPALSVSPSISWSLQVNRKDFPSMIQLIPNVVLPEPQEPRIRRCHGDMRVGFVQHGHQLAEAAGNVASRPSALRRSEAPRRAGLRFCVARRSLRRSTRYA
jgi:hypothetical protein